MSDQRHTRLPPEFLEGLDRRARWMYETLDRQATDHEELAREIKKISGRLATGDATLARHQKSIDELQRTRLILTSRWSVVAILVAGVAWPILLLVIGRYLSIHLGLWAPK